MSTRATIKIKESVYLTSEDIDNRKLTELSILLYHHSDGMPDGIGADLLEFLRDRNDSVWKDNEVMWDAEAIALDLVRGACLTSSSYSEVKEVHRDMGYVPAVCVHGDCEYGYVIDCDERKLTCYEIYPDRHPEWREKDIVEVPDKWTQFGGLHLSDESEE